MGYITLAISVLIGFFLLYLLILAIFGAGLAGTAVILKLCTDKDWQAVALTVLVVIAGALYILNTNANQSAQAQQTALAQSVATTNVSSYPSDWMDTTSDKCLKDAIGTQNECTCDTIALMQRYSYSQEVQYEDSRFPLGVIEGILNKCNQ